jgi:hypothetical protein
VLTIAAVHAASVIPVRNEAKSARSIAPDFAGQVRSG